MAWARSSNRYFRRILQWQLHLTQTSCTALDGPLELKQGRLEFTVVSRQSSISPMILAGGEFKVRKPGPNDFPSLAHHRLEGFGEDKVLTSHIGVAYSSGLSKNKSWSDPDAVYPIMKVRFIMIVL